MTAPRVRFAPSPTGYLHIGGARTALFNWLYARQHKGTFVLRIEDTDQARSTQASVDAIFEAMRWMGLDWDEGPGAAEPFGPYFQTQRLHIYKEYADKLIASGHAYRSYETKEELAAAREAATAAGQKAFKYESPWRDRTDGPTDQPHVVRFKMPRTEQAFGFDDLVYGHIEKKAQDMDDWIMIRPDGIPTYNFGAAIDDLTMGITLVARGDDHVNNTPPQVAVFQALGKQAPAFAHLPMILGADKTRLSKRHGAVSVMQYKEDGYLPHALVNFLARFGWSHGDQETFTQEELVQFFGFDHVGKTAGVFNPEKLLWLNNHWIRAVPEAEIARLLVPHLQKRGVTTSADDKLTAIVVQLRERAKTLEAMADDAKVFYVQGVTIDEKAGTKQLLGKRPWLEAVRERVRNGPFDAPSLDQWFKDQATERNEKLGNLAQPVRVAVTGTTVSPPLFDTLVLIGRDEALRRLDDAITWTTQKTPPAA